MAGVWWGKLLHSKIFFLTVFWFLSVYWKSVSLASMNCAGWTYTNNAFEFSLLERVRLWSKPASIPTTAEWPRQADCDVSLQELSRVV